MTEVTIQQVTHELGFHHEACVGLVRSRVVYLSRIHWYFTIMRRY